MINTVCCIYSKLPADDKQLICLKHVEEDYWNNLGKKWILLVLITQIIILSKNCNDDDNNNNNNKEEKKKKKKKKKQVMEVR